MILRLPECGVRFLTDQLNGDVYCRISRPGLNLILCRIHLKLVQDAVTA